MSRTSQTFAAPNGVKLRCQSHRRYWVVEYWTGTDGTDRAQVVLRTDNRGTGESKARSSRLRALYDSVWAQYATILHTTKG